MQTLSQFLSYKIDSSLTESQNDAYQAFLLGKNVFITGSAGTGKSFLINKIIRFCKRNNREFAITALTGAAACLIGGKTIHSWASIGKGDKDISYYIREILKVFPRKIKYFKCRVLIIDEISMMDAKLFELLDEVCKGVPNNPKPFGGIQVVLLGDFYQLPPVGDTQFCFESSIWDEVIDVHIMLKEIVRQKEETFQKILQEVREGEISHESIEILLDCKNKQIDNSLGIIPTKLYSTRRSVDKINKEEFEKLDIDQIYDYEAFSELLGEKVKRYHTDELQKIEEMLDKDFPYEKELSLCIGCQVMLLINLDLEEGLVNGSRGVIVAFQDDKPIVRFVNGIEKEIDYYSWEYDINETNKILRNQIPLKLAWAITVHKSQGCTLDYVEIDIGSSVFECGQSYVALSRVRTLDGLFIKDIDIKKIKAHPKVVEFYKNKF